MAVTTSIEPYDRATIKRMVHQCYRDLIGAEGELIARQTARALLEQLTGEDAGERIAPMLQDVWIPGAIGDPWNIQPGPQGKADMARHSIIG